MTKNFTEVGNYQWLYIIYRAYAHVITEYKDFNTIGILTSILGMSLVEINFSTNWTSGPCLQRETTLKYNCTFKSKPTKCDIYTKFNFFTKCYPHLEAFNVCNSLLHMIYKSIKLTLSTAVPDHSPTLIHHSLLVLQVHWQQIQLCNITSHFQQIEAFCRH